MWSSFRDKGDKDSFSGTSMAVRCYESHPTLKFGKGTLIGGSASHPMEKDADVYVSLQSGSTSGKISDPWDDDRKVVEIQYAISDMHAPTNVPRFKMMVTWLCNQLHDGRTVHVGCVGGHGRTGVVVSAIVAELMGKKDAIQWVRKHYCKKAVESKSQIKFLMEHYAVEKAEPTKDFSSSSTSTKSWDASNGGGKWHSLGSSKKSEGSKYDDLDEPRPRKVIPEGVTSKTRTFNPMTSARSLWKSKRK